MSTLGSYRGVRYCKHRACDILNVKSKKEMFFLYKDGKTTGDCFSSLCDLQQHVDDSQPPGVPGEPIRFEVYQPR